MIEEVVQDIADKYVKEQYPQIHLPGAMLATVTKAAKLGDTYPYRDMKIEGCSECPPYTATITGPWYEYSLKILTRDGAVDGRFPEIPQVKSKHQVARGGTVAVAMLYGETRPYILGEAK